MIDLKAIEERAAKATPGPWRSMRDGNQYIETRYLPTAKCVGASRIQELPRPWNPHAAIAFGQTAESHEVSRFLDSDADFIAHARTDIPALCQEVRELRLALVKYGDHEPSCEQMLCSEVIVACTCGWDKQVRQLEGAE